MALAAEVGIDRLERRLIFLQDRAKAHLEQRGPRKVMNIACAGNLLKDAAAAALLLQDYAKASELLVQAGQHWSDLGLFAGYSLLAMGQPEAWWDDRRWQLDMVADELAEVSKPVEAAAPREPQPERAPMLAGAAGSTRQLLHLYQSLRPHADKDDIAARLLGITRKRLSEASTAQVGATEVPLRAYLHLFDAAMHGDFDSSARETLKGLVVRRTEQLEAARADEYHWRLGLAPAALVDFDLLVLLTASMDARETADELTVPFYGRSQAVSVPVIAARGLRPGQSWDSKDILQD